MKRKIPFYEDFYVMDLVIRSSKFNRLLKDFYTYFKRLNCPIPTKGFPNLKGFRLWEARLNKTGYVYSDQINNIITSFNLSTSNTSYYNCLIDKIFFGGSPTDIKRLPPYQIYYESQEVHISLKEKITLQQWKDLWQYIKLAQNQHSRNKAWLEHDKYADLYLMYLDMVSKQPETDKNRPSIIDKIKLHPNYEQFKKKYKTILNDENSFYVIIEKCKERFGSLTLL